MLMYQICLDWWSHHWQHHNYPQMCSWHLQVLMTSCPITCLQQHWSWRLVCWFFPDSHHLCLEPFGGECSPSVLARKPSAAVLPCHAASVQNKMRLFRNMISSKKKKWHKDDYSLWLMKLPSVGPQVFPLSSQWRLHHYTSMNHCKPRLSNC